MCNAIESTLSWCYTMEFLLQFVSQRWEKKIHCKSQQTRYTLQSRATICNGFRKSPQPLQKVERELYDKMKYEDLGYITDRVNTVVFNFMAYSAVWGHLPIRRQNKFKKTGWRFFNLLQ